MGLNKKRIVLYYIYIHQKKVKLHLYMTQYYLQCNITQKQQKNSFYELTIIEYLLLLTIYSLFPCVFCQYSLLNIN